MQAELPIIDVIRAFGGTARWSQLKGKVSRRRLTQTVRAGYVLCDFGTYSLRRPTTRLELHVASGGLDRIGLPRSIWGFALPPLRAHEAERHDIAVAPNAVRTNVPDDIRLCYLDLAEDDCMNGVLSAVATVAFCVRIAMLNANSANAFESSCRALLVEAGIQGFEPQVHIRNKGRWIGQFDLVHAGRRIVIECDGFEHHGGLDAMTRDCIRHTRLTAGGWRTLRFTWYQVMHRPDWVLEQVRDTIAYTNQGPSELEASH